MLNQRIDPNGTWLCQGNHQGGPVWLQSTLDLTSCPPALQDVWSSVRRWVVLSDDRVASLHAEAVVNSLNALGCPVDVITVPEGEASKSRATKADVEDRLLALGCGRDTGLMALGGGVVSDLGGFVAATYLRGIPVVYLPTSLLAMVDAAYGGKTGINLPAGKNLLGAMVAPRATVLALDVLRTLASDAWRWAMAEVVKHAWVGDPALGHWLMGREGWTSLDDVATLVAWNHAIKQRVVRADWSDNRHQRAVLNAGHTVGHALERWSGYRWPHGQAVAVGLAAESWFQHRQGRLLAADHQQLMAWLHHVGLLPVASHALVGGCDALLDHLAHDKKNQGGKVGLVRMAGAGRPEGMAWLDQAAQQGLAAACWEVLAGG